MSEYLGWLVSYTIDGERQVGTLIEFQVVVIANKARAFALCFCEDEGCPHLVDVLDNEVNFEIEGDMGKRPMMA